VPAAPVPGEHAADEGVLPRAGERFSRISQIAYAEEEAFRRTLASGTTILDTAVAKAKSSGRTTLAGDQAFALHDTYGFPIDLTLEMAAEQGVQVDEDGFRRLMKEQRDRAKADARSKKSAHGDTSAYRVVAGLPRARSGVHRVRRDRLGGAGRRLLIDGASVMSAAPETRSSSFSIARRSTPRVAGSWPTLGGSRWPVAPSSRSVTSSRPSRARRAPRGGCLRRGEHR
jgi:hypothetical protein